MCRGLGLLTWCSSWHSKIVSRFPRFVTVSSTDDVLRGSACSSELTASEFLRPLAVITNARFVAESSSAGWLRFVERAPYLVHEGPLGAACDRDHVSFR